MTLRQRIARRKRRRDRFRRFHHGRAALREARAIQHLRALLDWRRKLPRVMFDDTSVDLIPRLARAVAGYTGGSWPTFSTLLACFPHARKVSIAINSIGRGRILDVEPGDATAAEAWAWWESHPDAKGFYTSQSNLGALVNALAAHGLVPKDYALWSAHYDGTRHICGPKTCGAPVEVDATQWTDRANDRSLDESVVLPSFWIKLKRQRG